MRKLAGIFFILIAAGLLWFALVPRGHAKNTITIQCPAIYADIVKATGEKYSNEMGTLLEFHPTKGDLIFDSASSVQALQEKGAVREVLPVARKGENETLSVGIFATCADPAAALHFARYLTAPGNFQASGFDAIPGDTWADKPELVIYSGSVNRPAVEELLNQFADREGIEITTIFNGCGILCAAMQAMTETASVSQMPDVYFACDLCFVPPVAKHFPEVILLTETDIGIALPKENPHQIKTLADLAKPGLKIGLCNQKQSTLGYMTAGILKSSGLDTSIRKNLSVEVPTADFLITQLRSGGLDAAIVYRVNAELQKEHLQFIKIKHEGARAVQPFSVRVDSDKQQLAKRLQDHFLAHPEAFTETGFTWRGDQGVLKSTEIEVPEWLRRQ